MVDGNNVLSSNSTVTNENKKFTNNNFLQMLFGMHILNGSTKLYHIYTYEIFHFYQIMNKYEIRENLHTMLFLAD